MSSSTNNQNAALGCLAVLVLLVACGQCASCLESDETDTASTGGAPEGAGARALSSVPAVDPWPSRDSAIVALAALVDRGEFAEASRMAGELHAAHRDDGYGPGAYALDSLRAIGSRADELAAYAEARSLPGSQLERNRDAYGALARRYPQSPRAGVYAEKRDEYAQRVVDRDNARFAPRATARAYGGCCKRCSKGKPCGDSCIARNRTCNKGPGCAC